MRNEGEDRSVAVALSGGVDSAVAAARLRAEGREVIGLTARLLPSDCRGERSCCDEQRARQLCAMLGIEHYVVDLSTQFAAEVITPFLQAYGAGLTPNPCLVCNPRVKFGALLDVARELGCSGIATGHYVQLAPRGGRLALRRACDATKDQSYMLLGLSQEQLAVAHFPLGSSLKADVVVEAERLGLPVAERESQDVCFVAGSVRDYLAAHLEMVPGPILDAAGNEVGRHRGLPLYTIGQRHGLGIGGTPRLFVVEKDVAANALSVGAREQLQRRRLNAPACNWVSIPALPPGETLHCLAMVRYRGKLIEAEVTADPRGGCEVRLGPHDQAIAPGQGLALYDEDGWLLGGGSIGAD